MKPLFSTSEIEKLLSEVIPSSPVEGVFDDYEIAGKPFRDKLNKSVIVPVIRYWSCIIYKEEDKYLRAISFILRKGDSADSQMLIFLGTNEALSRITPAELLQTAESKVKRLLEALANVEWDTKKFKDLKFKDSKIIKKDSKI